MRPLFGVIIPRNLRSRWCVWAPMKSFWIQMLVWIFLVLLMLELLCLVYLLKAGFACVRTMLTRYMLIPLFLFFLFFFTCVDFSGWILLSIVIWRAGEAVELMWSCWCWRVFQASCWSSWVEGCEIEPWEGCGPRPNISQTVQLKPKCDFGLFKCFCIAAKHVPNIIWGNCILQNFYM